MQGTHTGDPNRGPTQRGGPHRGPTTGGEGHTGDPHRTHTDISAMRLGRGAGAFRLLLHMSAITIDSVLNGCHCKLMKAGSRRMLY